MERSDYQAGLGESWRPELVRAARVLVAGAGALGNEILKNLALLGVGRITVVDEDVIESGNLWKSPLFRREDVGQGKASVAARRLQELQPGIAVTALQGALQEVLGLGLLRQHGVVIAGLDNRAARVWLNQACALVQVAWVDGGIEPFAGIVRSFRPPHYACYACTMSEMDWEQLAVAQSCSAPPRGAQLSLPTSPLSAAVIGALQVQAAMAILHGDRRACGRGVHVELAQSAMTRIAYPIAPDCPLHDLPPELVTTVLTSDASFAEIWAAAEQLLGAPGLLRLSRDIPGIDRVIGPGSALLERTPRQVGLPEEDIVWARRGTRELGLLLDNAEGVRGCRARR